MWDQVLSILEILTHAFDEFLLQGHHPSALRLVDGQALRRVIPRKAASQR